MFSLNAARSLLRTIDRADLRAIALVGLSVAVVGVSYGLGATGAGFPLWQILLLAIAVFGASAEILFVGVVAAGGAPLAAALAALLVNVRALPYGMAVGGFLTPGRLRLLGAHLANDETVALALGGATPERRRALFWVSGAAVALAWPLGALTGSLLGAVVADPAVLGLDAVFPAVLLALALPALRGARTAAAATAGAVIALAALPIAPLGLAPVLGLAGLLVAGRRA
ncbi:Predicted branched-chain amino acid permease (azaleucine resistance) [Rathayibacter oskolensis]|uniref:Predicted branched-chain amino acid permease (Azaleucine resistance) n=1 Tax=Rathayibacter oskolensis TaxID=1891671 RepID=A0A1X7MY74_9MICO|nr:AzlC family ABC transporter permease [Rathayibacter oskolensis]SMH29833.1 Predicted branched-chain amino acid permease (azaleucine resistance) [Rathayibacter oskolensis]